MKHFDQRLAPNRRRVVIAVTTLASLLGVGRAEGQTVGGRSYDRLLSPAAAMQPVPKNRTHVFAINPLGIPFEVVSIEVEQAVQSAFSVAANFSYFSPSDYTRSSFEIKGRLYPNEEAPRAFAVGLGLGAVNTREHRSVAGVDDLVDKTSPSIAVYVDYNWLLGRSERFYVGSGLGAKRILGDSDAFDRPPFVYGTARFLIGVAF